MAIAQAEGRHPVEAARDYDIINNRPAKKAEAMLRDFIKAGGTVKWHSLTDELADATFTHPQTGEVRIDWDTKRAMTAFGKKDMYTKFPRQMLRSRVVSEGVRTLWPLATSGMYVPEEQAAIPHNGPTIDAEPDAREALNAEIPLRAAAAEAKKPARKVDPKVYEAADGDVEEYAEIYAKHDIAIELLDEPTVRKWMDNLEMLLTNARSQEVVVAIGAHRTVGTAIAKAPPAIKARVSELLANAYARFAEPEDELPEVEIAGEEKAGAG
jgi:hypothetical protein